MNTADAQAEDQGPSGNCAECGTDFNLGRKKPQHWHQPSILIPRLAWLFILCLFVAYTTPWFQSKMGNPNAVFNHSVGSHSRHMHVLNPPLQAFTIFDYPEEAETILAHGFGNLSIKEPHWWCEDSEFRFMFYRGHGFATDSIWNGLGAAWWGTSATTRLRNVNTQRSFDWTFDYALDTVTAGSYGVFDGTDTPAFTTKNPRLHGGQLETRFLSIVNILDAVIASVFTTMLACSLISKFIRAIHTAIVVTLAVLVTGGILYLGSQMRENEQFILSLGNPPSDAQLSRWYSADEFKALQRDPEARTAFLEEERELFYSAKPGGVLAFQTKHRHGTEIRWDTGAYSEFHPIWIFIKHDFTRELADGTMVPTERCDQIPAGLHINMDPMFTRVNLSYGGEQSELSLQVFWMKLLALIALSWWILRAIQWASMQLVYRVQASRFEQNLCVVCKYPKTDWSCDSVSHEDTRV